MARAVIQIQGNREKIDSRYTLKVAWSAQRAASKYKIPLNIILAIAYVESAYRLNAVNKASDDFGIMQVNAWHIKNGVDKQRLLTDMDYSFQQGTRIFKWFYDRYPLEEAISRYNCGTRKNCTTWTSVIHYLNKVKDAL